MHFMSSILIPHENSEKLKQEAGFNATHFTDFFFSISDSKINSSAILPFFYVIFDVKSKKKTMCQRQKIMGWGEGKSDV